MGNAVSVTTVPVSNFVVQTAPQSMPAGALVTVPLPIPIRETLKVSVGTGLGVNVAAQLRFAVMLTLPSVQSASPDQASNSEFASGVAVRVTAVPSRNDAAHTAPQSTPAGALVTVPPPDPARDTVRVHDGIGLNVAVHARAASMVREPSLQSASPDQPPNVAPASAVAVNVTTVPDV